MSRDDKTQQRTQINIPPVTSGISRLSDINANIGINETEKNLDEDTVLQRTFYLLVVCYKQGSVAKDTALFIVDECASLTYAEASLLIEHLLAVMLMSQYKPTTEFCGLRYEVTDLVRLTFYGHLLYVRMVTSEKKYWPEDFCTLAGNLLRSLQEAKKWIDSQ